MEKEHEEVSIARSGYADDYDFWEDVALLIRILTKNDYQLCCRLEECCENAVFIIEYNYNEDISGLKTKWEANFDVKGDEEE